MKYTSFLNYFAALVLTLPSKDQLVSVLASSGVQVYPFQFTAANYVLRMSRRKGSVLCNATANGKRYKAMQGETVL